MAGGGGAGVGEGGAGGGRGREAGSLEKEGALPRSSSKRSI